MIGGRAHAAIMGRPRPALGRHATPHNRATYRAQAAAYDAWTDATTAILCAVTHPSRTPADLRRTARQLRRTAAQLDGTATTIDRDLGRYYDTTEAP